MSHEALPPDIREFVDRLLAEGRYQSYSEIVLDGLFLLKDEETLRQAKLAELRAMVEVGLDQLDRGEIARPEDVTPEAIAARGMRRLAEQRRRASA